MKRQLKSTRNNVFGRFTLEQMIVGIVFFAILSHIITMSMDYGVMDGSIIGITLVILAAMISGIYITFFMAESTLYNSIAMITYGFNYVTGNTKTKKYVCNAAHLKTKLPIETIHENGIIEFPKKQFGVLLNLYRPHISEAGHAMFLLKNIDTLNSLPIGIIYKSFNFSAVDTETPLIEQVKCSINDPETTPEMKKHLYSSHETLTNTPGKIIWSGYGFIGVGKYKNADDALTKSKVDVEVVMSGLRHSNIVPYIIDDRYDIILAYKQMLSMRRVF